MIGDKQVTIIGRCVVTKKPYSVTVWEHDMAKFESGEDLIQNIFPYLSSGDREFIKTGISPEGWKRMVKEEK